MAKKSALPINAADIRTSRMCGYTLERKRQLILVALSN